jgi:hypothetical protein
MKLIVFSPGGTEKREVEAKRLPNGKLAYVSPFTGKQVEFTLEGKPRRKMRSYWMRKDIEQLEGRLAYSRRCPERQKP